MDTQTHKAAIEAELAKITSDLEAIATLNTETGDWVAIPDTDMNKEADPNAEADSTEEWNERRALLVQLETRYRNFKKAESKIETNTFGLCEICGSTIEEDRLAVNPAARTCKEHLEEESQLPE